MRIAIPDFISNSYFPVIAAVDLGLFKEEGIDATVELFFPVTKLMGALRDGQFDLAAGAAHATLVGFPEWRGAKLLAALAQHMYWFLIVRSDLHPQRGDLSVLKGLRIGAAPGPDAGLLCLLEEAGFDLQRDRIEVGPIPGATGPGASFGVSAAQALEAGTLDGFWANGMGAEVAVRNGVGTVVLDVRRGDGPTDARSYTFPALVATEKQIDENPADVASAVRALVKAQRLLREDPAKATEVGNRLFPTMEAGLIAELIRRDTPYYDPCISRETVAGLNRFAQRMRQLPGPVPYERVVATQFVPLWHE